VSARRGLRVYVEVGEKRTFAGAVEWPGWQRGARTQDAALQALLDYLPRYRNAIGRAARDLEAPRDSGDLHITERVPGNATTEFGAPGVPPQADSRPLDDEDLERLVRLQQACWRALDRAAAAAEGKELAKGPRGGGRDLDEIVLHVLDADAGYLRALGVSYPGAGRLRLHDAAALRNAIVAAVRDAPRDGPPPTGPKGGKRWTVRYFVRRSAWHALDHAWEIEDRSGEAEGGSTTSVRRPSVTRSGSRSASAPANRRTRSRRSSGSS